MMRTSLLIGFLVYGVVCQKQLRPTSTTTTTIPWTGPTVTSATLVPCSGPATVVIQTPFPTPTCPPPIRPAPCEVFPGCDAEGLNIDYYHNPVLGFGSGNMPSSYYITEGLSPLDSSLTNVTFFPQDFGPDDPADTTWTRDTNGGIVVNGNNFTMVYSGFYRAPVTGVFTLCGSADNQNDIFFGRGNAFSCDTGDVSPGASPLVVSTGGFLSNPINCTDVYLVQGRYYPVRNVMGNYHGPSAFNFTIWEPNVPFEEQTNEFTGDVFPLSCRWLF